MHAPRDARTGPPRAGCYDPPAALRRTPMDDDSPPARRLARVRRPAVVDPARVPAGRPPEPRACCELLIVLVLILFNAFFAMSEMAVLTSRKSRLKHMARDQPRRAQGAAAGRASGKLPVRGAAVDQPAEPDDRLLRRRVDGREDRRAPARHPVARALRARDRVRRRLPADAVPVRPDRRAGAQAHRHAAPGADRRRRGLSDGLLRQGGQARSWSRCRSARAR